MYKQRLFIIVATLLCVGAGTPDVKVLIERGKYATSKTAAKLAEQILSTDPSCGEAYSLRGLAKYGAKDYVGAIRDFDKAIELKLHDQFYRRTTLNYKYHCYIELKDWKKALPTCIECLNIEPSYSVANDATLLCKKTGDSKDAAKYAQLEARYKKEHDKVISRLIAANDPKKAARLAAQLGEELTQKPKDIQLLALKSRCEMTLGQYKDACRDLTTMIGAEPLNFAGYFLRAKAYEKLGDKQRSEVDMKRARELQPEIDLGGNEIAKTKAQGK